MSMLHVYKKVGKEWSHIVDGEGEISETFNITLTSSGSVSKGQTYQVRQGQKVDGPLCTCLVGADSRGEVAEFKMTMTTDVATAGEGSYELQLQGFKDALAGVQKSVTIQINEQDLRVLKTGNYMFCFAKKVGDAAYNVVWQASAAYLSTNEFSWTPQYQLFGSNKFVGNVTVSVSTNIQNINLGETALLDGAGFLNTPTTGGPATSLTLNNQYGTIRPGVNAVSTGIDGTQASTPIYVAVQPVVQGPTVLTPVEKVLVWFEQNVVTSTMFSDSRSNPVEIDLTMSNSATRLYKDGKWTTP